jgi:hypothetical protein
MIYAMNRLGLGEGGVTVLREPGVQGGEMKLNRH